MNTFLRIVLIVTVGLISGVISGIIIGLTFFYATSLVCDLQENCRWLLFVFGDDGYESGGRFIMTIGIIGFIMGTILGVKILKRHIAGKK